VTAAAALDWWGTRDDSDLARGARTLFTGTFGPAEPAGVWAAPGRVNLVGEHVDYAGGMSLPFALPQNTAAAVGRRDDGLLRIVSLPPGETSPEQVTVDLGTVGPGQPAGWAGYVAGAVWAGLADGVIPTCAGLDIALVSDVPVGAGLSSSAALECSVALAAHELAVGRGPDAAETAHLVTACMRAENEVVGASTGGLDQRSALYGRAGQVLAVDFLHDRVDLLPCDMAGEGLALLVINTNADHALVDGQYASRRGVVDAVADWLGAPTLNAAVLARRAADPSFDVDAAVRDWAATPEAATLLGGTGEEETATALRRIHHVLEEIDRTFGSAVPLLRAGKVAELGPLLSASHASLRDLFEVTVPELDCAQEAALAAGALGARMIGGGFGGAVIALVREDAVAVTADTVAGAAANRGLAAPTFFTATPSAGARRIG
jgi:galactokinase